MMRKDLAADAHLRATGCFGAEMLSSTSVACHNHLAAGWRRTPEARQLLLLPQFVQTYKACRLQYGIYHLLAQRPVSAVRTAFGTSQRETLDVRTLGNGIH